MKRRDLLLGLAAGTAITSAGSVLLYNADQTKPDPRLLDLSSFDDLDPPPLDPPRDSEMRVAMPQLQPEAQIQQAQMPPASQPASIEAPLVEQLTAPTSITQAPQAVTQAETETPAIEQVAASKEAMKPNLDKVRFFENEFADDIYLAEEEKKVLLSVVLRLGRVQKVVGHGNFNVLSFDNALAYAKKYSRVGEFTEVEKTFMESIFEAQASDYGFFGDKVSSKLTENISSGQIVKIPYSGHYLFKGDSVAYYNKLKKDVGKNIILTSGIRSNVKQMYLFLNKAVHSEFNLSKASRSLAPPGHSFHGIGDFDVGRVGWGHLNFTDKFSETREFKRMEDLGYVQIRYTTDNELGVRYEPWHIKVV
ncbi:MAG: M15 family metallopeptidase [Cellvibrionaceae bacterium]|nr:M15 family metallopeptidase [Cellvibrionaceae bacterium]MCV6626523.1 M15 family metallopeptidase [Cellvibrionaceae bacterium]